VRYGDAVAAGAVAVVDAGAGAAHTIGDLLPGGKTPRRTAKASAKSKKTNAPKVKAKFTKTKAPKVEAKATKPKKKVSAVKAAAEASPTTQKTATSKAAKARAEVSTKSPKSAKGAPRSSQRSGMYGKRITNNTLPPSARRPCLSAT
jgi:hypothetical protein